MRFFDAHNHLQDERFCGHQSALLDEAKRAGIVRMVVNGGCEADWPAVEALAKSALVLPSYGYHPWYLHERTPDWQKTLARFLDGGARGVGEIGLDRWKPGLAYEGQEEVFLLQLQMATDRELPVSIHCLDAWGRLQEMLSERPRPRRGFLLHSYGGSKELVQPLARLGAYFGFPGYYLQEKKIRRRETFRSIPLDRLLIETDAPDQLLPDEKNQHPLTDATTGKAINHPANLPAVYEGLAEFLGISLGSLVEHTEENFHRLFGPGPD